MSVIWNKLEKLSVEVTPTTYYLLATTTAYNTVSNMGLFFS